jgi:hypothetical protein
MKSRKNVYVERLRKHFGVEVGDHKAQRFNLPRMLTDYFRDENSALARSRPLCEDNRYEIHWGKRKKDDR